MQALVCTLLDVFEATRDLYRTLTTKEQREYEQNLRAKGYPVSRRVEYVNDERLGSDEAFVTDKAAVTRQFDIGYQAVGAEFAMGDGMHFSSMRLHKLGSLLHQASLCFYQHSSNINSYPVLSANDTY